MANFVYSKALTKILSGSINFATDDIRVALVMANSTAGTDEDVEFVSGITTLDEMDGTGYARVALANQAVVETLASDRAAFDADNVALGTLANGTRQVLGAIVYKHVTNDADSIPIVWIDNADVGGTTFPFNPNGGEFTLTWDATGIVLLNNAA